MTTVWVTRTEPGATRLAATLEAAGFEAWVAPVLEIEPLATDPPGGAFDVGVFLSAHAVHAADRVRAQLSSVLAIGERTRSELEDAGVRAGTPDEATSEGVLTWFDDHASRGRVLIVAGEGGRDWLAPRLRERGFTVEEWFVYRRRRVAPAVDHTTVGAIVIASGDGAAEAGKVWFGAGGGPRIPVVVPSPRVAVLAISAGFQAVSTAAGAGPDDVVAEVRRALGV